MMLNTELLGDQGILRTVMAFLLLPCAFAFYGCGLGSSGARKAVESQTNCSQRSAPSTDFAETIVTPYLDHDIEAGKNLIWCATFQMAWNELQVLCKGPVKTAPGSVSVQKLNRETLSPDDLPQSGTISAAGLVGDGIIEEIQRQIEQLPGVTQAGRLLPERDLPDDYLLIYTYLKRSLHFATPFTSIPAMSFGDAHKVEAFGIEDYSGSSEQDRRQGRQVRILWHRFQVEGPADVSQEFIVELLASGRPDRLIFASISPSATLQETVSNVMELIEKPNRKQATEDIPPELIQIAELDEGDVTQEAFQGQLASISGYAGLLLDESLKIPKVRVDVQRSFPDLEGQTIVCPSEKVRDKPIDAARQWICFELNERGADLESEAFVGIFGNMALRDFTFAEPFLVLLMRQGAARPYFAMWAANPEVLVTSEQQSRKGVKGVWSE
jgi:hypothetical protein